MPSSEQGARGVESGFGEFSHFCFWSIRAYCMLILDAFNLLHAVRSALPSWRGIGLLELARAVADSPPLEGVSGTGKGQDVLFVCDGTGGGMAQRTREQSPILTGRSNVSVRLVFAGPGKEADALIRTLLDEQAARGSARGCVVVSSDRQVQTAAKGVFAKTMASDDYLRRLARWFPPTGPERLPRGSSRIGDQGTTGDAAGGVDERGQSGPDTSRARERLQRDLQSWAADLRLDDVDMAQWLKHPPSNPDTKPKAGDPD